MSYIPEPEKINYWRIGGVCLLASIFAPMEIHCNNLDYLENDIFIMEQLEKTVDLVKKTNEGLLESQKDISELQKDISVITRLIIPGTLEAEPGIDPKKNEVEINEIFPNPYTHSFEKTWGSL